MLAHMLSALPRQGFAARVIVAADRRMLAAARAYGFAGVVNTRPELGIARSIGMGLARLPAADACMFCVCDQPFLREETITAMLESYKQGEILCLSCGGVRGNPVIFPAALFAELAELSSGESGKTVMSRHPALLRLHEITDPLELADVDTREGLASLLAMRPRP